MNEERTQEVIRQLLAALNQDVTSEGLAKTPERVAKAYTKMLEGYSRNLKDEMTVFSNLEKYDDIIYSGHIKFFSTCEHHLLPFFGTAHVAYIPNDKIAGISKLSKAVDVYSRRLQLQERMTMQIANELDSILQPRGVAILLEGQHLCSMARGVQQFNSHMKTMAFRGDFKANVHLREQFINMTK